MGENKRVRMRVYVCVWQIESKWMRAHANRSSVKELVAICVSIHEYVWEKTGEISTEAAAAAKSSVKGSPTTRATAAADVVVIIVEISLSVSLVSFFLSSNKTCTCVVSVFFYFMSRTIACTEPSPTHTHPNKPVRCVEFRRKIFCIRLYSVQFSLFPVLFENS